MKASTCLPPRLKGKTAAVLAYLKERAAAGQPWPVPQAEAALPFLPPIR
jgi:hypothetical protein